MTNLAHRLVEVALPVPLFQTFVYSLGGEYEHEVRVGSRVLVPFRKRQHIGIVTALDAAPPEKGTVKAVARVPDAEAAFDESLLALARWIAEYYVVPIGLVMRTMLPASLTGAAQPAPSLKTRRIVRIREDIPTLLQREKAFGRAPQQRALFELIESVGGATTVDHLLEKLKFSPSVLKALEKRALISIDRERVDRDPFATRKGRREPRHAPTPEQRAAIERMINSRPGEVFLLHGVTGSGKTLVYIELLREIVERRGKTAIVLVPEIALTPQTVDRFRAVFGDDVAVLHSALSDGERYDAWVALRSGEKRIVVGARSAVFAPLRNLGAIIVDEEHESSYKQGETPRYHAREAAIIRATHEGAMVVLGSATPSLESWTKAENGKYTLLTLPNRTGGASLPVVEVVDLRQKSTSAEPGSGVDEYQRIITTPLDLAIHERLRAGEQSILLLNRRGYSAFVQCENCGNVATCPNCSITLTYHRSPERLVCHYCLHHEEPQRACSRCGGMTLRRRGLGTQQVERLVTERFPSARVARMDVDTTSGKWAHAEILDRVGNGEIDILLGTQMIAKGLDFPNVTLVGVIDADVGINLPDFRASERCFQLLSQVAGRSGRGTKGGEVLIQTRLPLHHAVVCAVRHDYLSFVSEELVGRLNPPYPPNNRLANIVFSGTVESSVADLAIAATKWLSRLIRAHDTMGTIIVGPAPAAVERIKARWRWHVLLKSEHPSELTRLGAYFMERFPVPARDGLRITFDRDPVSLL